MAKCIRSLLFRVTLLSIGEVGIMQVGCTKKLLDHIGVKGREFDEGIDPLLTWSAHLITVNHRRTIFVINDATIYRFVLYGVKKKNLENLETLLLEGVMQCLQAEGISPEIQRRYREELGSGITYTKTRSRSLIARLNAAKGRVYFDQELLNSNTVHQRHLLHKINRDYYTVDNSFYSVIEEFAQRLSSRYTLPPYSATAGEFLITLNLPVPCYRRVIVPLHATFRIFHTVIQLLFSWRGRHLHEWRIDYDGSGRVSHFLSEGDMEIVLEHQRYEEDGAVLLSEVFPGKEKVEYIYDFGDYWEHTVKLERIVEGYDSAFPVCIDWQGETPPEDVGGVSGYEEYLEILSGKTGVIHSEDAKRWAGSQSGEAFDLEKVNLQLTRNLRW